MPRPDGVRNIASIGNSHGFFHRLRVPILYRASWSPSRWGWGRTSGVSPHAQSGGSPGRPRGAPRHGEPPPRRTGTRDEPLACARRPRQPASATGHGPDGALETGSLRCGEAAVALDDDDQWTNQHSTGRWHPALDVKLAKRVANVLREAGFQVWDETRILPDDNCGAKLVNGRTATVESWDPAQPLLYALRNALAERRMCDGFCSL
jgi:hypothetical protein